MDSNTLLGLFLLLLGAGCGGSFGLPSKLAPKDTPWEVLWGPFFFITTIIIPIVLLPILGPDAGIFGRVGIGRLMPVLVFGLLWGLGSMTLGMSFSFLGLSLAYSLNYGAQIAFGSLMPLAIFQPHQFLTAHGGVTLVGIAACLVGVVVSGRAGMLRERDEERTADAGVQTAVAIQRPRLLIGLGIGIASGILCACYGVAWNYAAPLKAAAGANSAFSVEVAKMAVILWGGAVSSCVYCAIQLTRKRTWNRLASPGIQRVVLLAGVMAILHDAAILLFGLGAARLGSLGGSVGYAVFMSFAIIIGNLHGFRAGEWKKASRGSINWIAAGIAILILGVCILAKANAMAASRGG